MIRADASGAASGRSEALARLAAGGYAQVGRRALRGDRRAGAIGPSRSPLRFRIA